jgi:hypothetical protein
LDFDAAVVPGPLATQLSDQAYRAGTAKDQILWIAPDFDAPLEDFRAYMQ